MISKLSLIKRIRKINMFQLYGSQTLIFKSGAITALRLVAAHLRYPGPKV